MARKHTICLLQKRITRIFLFAFLPALILSSCRTIMQIPDERNLADLYNPSSSFIHPVFHVYHENDDVSILTIKLFPAELLFNKANELGEYQAKVKIDYELIEIGDRNEKDLLVDSMSNVYTLGMDEANQRYFADIPVQAKAGKEYMLRIFTTDLLRRSNVESMVFIDKTSIYGPQNFRVYYKSSGILAFDPKVMAGHPFTIFYNKVRTDSIFVKFFKNRIDLPSPSFSSAPTVLLLKKPDSVWILPYSDTITYALMYEGMYHFQVDTSVNDGLTLFRFHKNFPKISEEQQLADPLAYLLTTPDYQEIQSARNKKLAVDNFWLGTNDNIERARELLRIYYSRVYFSNYYFTSSKEGWKTDRGMIYIIYGQPSALYKSVNQEKWVYYDKTRANTISFTFNRVKSPFTLNEFVLERGEHLSSHWREAVLTWRNGEVFSLDNRIY